jgi:hypothetical protein
LAKTQLLSQKWVWMFGDNSLNNFGDMGLAVTELIIELKRVNIDIL